MAVVLVGVILKVLHLPGYRAVMSAGALIAAGSETYTFMFLPQKPLKAVIHIGAVLAFCLVVIFKTWRIPGYFGVLLAAAILGVANYSWDWLTTDNSED